MLPAVLALSLALSPSADTVVWESDYDVAFEKAVERNCPVLICINMDEEWANDELANKVYRETEFVELSKKFVCMPASVFNHPTSDSPDGCGRFVGIPCAAHKLIEIQARGQFIGGSVAIAPQHIIASPKGELIAREAYFEGREPLYALLDSVFNEDGSMIEFESLPKPKKGSKANRVTSAAVPRLQLKELRERFTTNQWKEQYQLIDDIGKLDRMTSVGLFTEIALHDDAAESLKKSAIRRLGKKGSYDTLDVLLELLGDKDVDIQIAAASALEVSELPDATEPLLKLMSRRPTDVLKCTLLRALGSCSGTHPRAQKALKSGLRDSNAFVRCSSALGLGYTIAAILRPGSEAKPTDAKDPIRQLMKALTDSQSQVRGAAAYALGVARVGEARDALQKMSEKDDNAQVRACAAAAIRNLDAEGNTVGSLADFRWKFSSEFLR